MSRGKPVKSFSHFQEKILDICELSFYNRFSTLGYRVLKTKTPNRADGLQGAERAEGEERRMGKGLVTVIGAGLAGCEAAHYLARHGFSVRLYDCKPNKFTPAHSSKNLAELVCSNSLKSGDVWGNACGLLKEEMRLLGSLVMEAADATKVPAGGALAVDREAFSAYITEKIRSDPSIEYVPEEVKELPQGYAIVATGPLTLDALAEDIRKKLGGALHFYDAAAPIVSAESIDYSRTFTADRYGKGEGDYVNCPMNKEEYEAFVEALVSAERAVAHEFEKGEIFEGCMPVEVMAARGRDTLRFGMLKPVGLYDENGKRPYAVLQLRKENVAGTAYNLVGFQTNLKFPEQKRVFSMIPALKNAEFLRYGVMHRNTYLDSPKILSADLSLKTDGTVFFAGQMTGVEGYVESADSGILAAMNCALKMRGYAPAAWDCGTVSGALAHHVCAETDNFQPMNANYGILSPLGLNVRDKALKKRMLAERALEKVRENAADAEDKLRAE